MELLISIYSFATNLIIPAVIKIIIATAHIIKIIMFSALILNSTHEIFDNAPNNINYSIFDFYVIII